MYFLHAAIMGLRLPFKPSASPWHKSNEPHTEQPENPKESTAGMLKTARVGIDSIKICTQ